MAKQCDLNIYLISTDPFGGFFPQSVVQIKGKFLYSTVSNPQDCSKRFTLYFPDRPVQSDTISTSLENIQPYATINA